MQTINELALILPQKKNQTHSRLVWSSTCRGGETRIVGQGGSKEMMYNWCKTANYSFLFEIMCSYLLFGSFNAICSVLKYVIFLILSCITMPEENHKLATNYNQIYFTCTKLSSILATKYISIIRTLFIWILHWYSKIFWITLPSISNFSYCQGQKHEHEQILWLKV